MYPDREKDIPYAHELYNRMLDSAMVNGKPLGSLLVGEKFNLWDVYSHIAFFDDCVRFSETKKFASVKAHYAEAHVGSFRGSAFLVGAALWGVTKLAALSMRLRGARVLIFSVDKDSAAAYHADFRIEKIYEVLSHERIAYGEFFHTLVRAASLSRLLRRRRVAMYLEAIDWLYFLFRSLRRLFWKRKNELQVSGLESFGKDEALFVEALIKKYVSMAPLVQFRIRMMTFFLKISGVRIIVGIDDARYYHELAVAARNLEVPFFVYQHGSGHYTPYHVGWLKDSRLLGERMYPEDIVVWNEYWKSELLALQVVWNEAHIHIGGNAKKEPTSSLRRGSPHDPVVIPFETDAPRDLVRGVAKQLGESGVSIVFKLRPDVPEAYQRKILEGVSGNIEFVQQISVPVSAVIGVYSTFLYEAVSAGVPVGVIESSLLYGKKLVSNGLGNVVSMNALLKDVDVIRNLDDVEIARRKQITEIGPFEDFFKSILKKAGIV